MHTPATTNRVPGRARNKTSSMIPGTPTASNTTAALTVSNGEPSAGSSTWCAPIVAANSRRFDEKSGATTLSTPRARSDAMMAMPIGPQPTTRAVSPGWMFDLLTACRPTAMGSVSAACLKSRPLGIRSDDGDADRTATNHQSGLAGLDVRLVDGMQTHRHGFGQRGMFEVQAVGDQI